MLVAIHQPLYFPWLGYLDRMARSDLFVVLDHVQFERRALWPKGALDIWC